MPAKSSAARLSRRILERDHHACVLHPYKRAVAVHHILSKGAHPELRNDPRNLCSVCADCHDDYANTDTMVRTFFEILRWANPEYNWEELPFSFYLCDTTRCSTT